MDQTVITPHDIRVGVRQTSLFASGPLGLPVSETKIRRTHLGGGAWVDHCPNWLPGADAWLEEFRSLEWAAARRPMYDRMVDVPRLICTYPRRGPDTPEPLEDVAAVMEQIYGRDFDRIGANWYRDGKDSVAWHSDKVKRPGDTIVAIVSVGQRRPFLLRPQGGGATRRWAVGDGDLLVMGGTAQATWQHAVPKVAHAGERICVMFRG